MYIDLKSLKGKVYRFLKILFLQMVQYVSKLFLILGLFFSIWGEDSPILYSDFIQSGFIQQEKKRVLCIFGFRKAENSELDLSYLENGISEILYSSLRDFDYIYEPNPLPQVIVYPFHSKEIKNKQNSSLLLEKKLISEQTLSKENAMIEGAKQNCEYVLHGEYLAIKPDKLKTKIFLTNRINGKNQILEKETSIRRAFQELQENSLELKKILSPQGLSEIKIETNEENVKVIIDDIYYGNTPFIRKDLTPDRHKITLEKDGFETLNFSVNLEKGKTKHLKAKLKKLEENLGYLNVDSNPRGAEVYLGNQLLGLTPLEKFPVKVGANRIRISLENYVDEFKAVEIEKEKTISLNVQLKQGNTKEYYKKRFYIFQDYSYFDFSLYSLYGSLIFYTSYMYAWHKIGKEEDKLYAITTLHDLNTLNRIEVLLEKINTNAPDLAQYQSSFFSELFYQQFQINKTQRNMNFYKTIQNFSIFGVLGMLTSSLVFYNLGINSEAIEFGYVPKTFWNPEEMYFSIRLSWN